MTERYLIVGLGNPGREYVNTRHNIGFRCVDAIATAHGLSFGDKKARALLADGVIDGKRVMLAKPQTFMNLSGESVRILVDFFKIPLNQVLVIMDDMDIPLGILRIRAKGSAGGQKGMKSIIEHLGTDAIARVRFGIGRPPGRMDPADYVLQDFGKDDTILLSETLDRVVKSISTWLDQGVDRMMTRWNGTAEDSARNAEPPVKQAPLPADGSSTSS